MSILARKSQLLGASRPTDARQPPRTLAPAPRLRVSHAFAAGDRSRLEAPRSGLRNPVATAVQSVDPLAASKAPWAPGNVFTVHSQEELDKLLAQHPGKLTVLMCKSSHCRPCKAFARKYMDLAQRFSDAIMLDIIGDESPECRKLMKDWGVKVTPTFRLFRGTEFLESTTGVKNEGEAVTTAILKHLGPNEAGRNWFPPEEESDDE